MIIDLGISGKHHYGVEACCAYDVDECKTDCFIGALIHSEPIKFDDLEVLIEDANARIAYEDMLEAEIVKQRALIADIRRRIESLNEELDDEEDKLEEMMNK
jgi:Skp family chaperone for outer membrane proteins